MSEKPIIALVFYGIRIKGKNQKLADEKLNEKLQAIRDEPDIEVLDSQMGKLEFDEDMEYNKNLPEDADEKDCIFVQQLQVEVKGKSFLDYVNFIFRHNPDGNMIESPSSVTLDINVMNQFNGTVQATHNNLLRQNLFMVEELRKLKPEMFKKVDEQIDKKVVKKSKEKKAKI